MMSIIAPDADAWTSPSMMLWKTCFSDMPPPRACALAEAIPSPLPIHSGYSSQGLRSTAKTFSISQDKRCWPRRARGWLHGAGLVRCRTRAGGARIMAKHPLEPLDANEFRRTAEVLRRDQGVTDSWRFASIELKEPPKRDVKAWKPGDPVGRVSSAVLWNREDNQAYEGTVDLVGDKVESWTHLPGVCPNFTVDEWHECDEAMRAHPDVVAALAARGVTDMSLLLIDVWTYGKALIPEKWRDRRLGWCDVWRREAPGSNPYAHLVSGIKFIVDMNTMELLQIEEDRDLGAPDVQGEYIPGIWTGEQRSDLTPLHITQPDGVSFTVEGTELRWQNWSMRLGV